MKLRLPNFGLTERLKDWVTGARDNDAVNMVLYDRTPAVADLRVGDHRLRDGDLGVDADRPTPGGRSVPVRQTRRAVPRPGVRPVAGDAARPDGDLAALQQRDVADVDRDAADRAGGGEFGKRGPRAGSRSARCAFSRRSCPSCRCSATWRAIWCARWKRYAATSGASASRWA